ncbi:methyltransferase-like protein 27 [Pholidichthys leucotaenia]
MTTGTRALEDVRHFMQSQKVSNPQETKNFYDAWAETFDQDSVMLKYRAPHLAVEFLNANISGDHGEKKVLDIACGSGWVAKLMYELGFRHFVGVDGSQCMLDLAAKTGFYQDLRLALLGPQPLPAKTDEYDVVIIVGALRQEYVPVCVIRELCNAAKPGNQLRVVTVSDYIKQKMSHSLSQQS